MDLSRPKSRTGRTLARAPLVAALLAALAGACSRAPEPPRVFLVVIDTLRHDALGCNVGAERGTPHIDALAREGVRFEQAISASGWTLPAMASLLTGTWPTVHKALGKNALLTPVSPDVPLVPELLAERGFTTLGFANAAFLSPVLGLGRGFDVYDHRHAYNDRIRRADETVDTALAAIHAHRREPLFVMVHLFDPHLDFDPPEPELSELVPPDRRPRPPISMRDCRRLQGPHGVPSRADIEYLRAVYQAEVTAVDRAIGRFVAGLVELGLYEGSTLVLTSDHGEEFWDHGDFEHGHTLYDELIRVPLLVKPPAELGLAGRTVEAQVRVLDVAPTVFDLLAIPKPPGFVGTSLLPLMRGEESTPRVAFSESTLYGSDKLSWRTERWHYVLDRNPAAEPPEELYDWRADPGTQRNLIEAQPRVALELRNALLSFKQDLELFAGTLADGQVQNLAPSNAERLLESLESLGYTGRDR